VICVIFATDKFFRTPSFLFDSVLKTEFIQKISDDYRLKEKVKFATIDLNSQSKFIDNIIINYNINLVGNRFSKKVIVLKRLDNEFVHFDVHDMQIQTSKQDLNRLIESLKNSINLILTESVKFSFKMNIPDFDEETSKFESIIIIFISIIIIIILMLSLLFLLDSLNK
jgi:hypothetical protein